MDNTQKDPINPGNDNNYQKPISFDANSAQNDNTANAVNDIQRSDSDQMLRNQDEQMEPIIVGKSTFGARLKNGFRAFWDNKWLRYGTISTVLVVTTVLIAVPVVRYGLLNVMGVRAKANVVVIDKDSNQPLKKVKVAIGESSTETDESGTANLSKLRLGQTVLKIEKLGYGEISQDINVGIGKNDFSSVSLKSTGVQIYIRLFDWLTGQVITKAEVGSGENSAFANSEGLILLTVPTPKDDKPYKVDLTADNYLSKTVEVDKANISDNKFEMTASPSRYFISKREGKHDIYRSDLDGKNEQVIIKGTGNERDDLRFSVNPENNLAALVSTRDGDHNEQGFALSGIHLVDLEKGELDWLDLAERVELVGWINEYLVYVRIGAADSGNYPQRQQMVSYNTKTGESKVIAATDSFNDVLASHGQIFYATSDSFKENPEPYFFKIDPSGNEKQVVINRVTWNIFHPAYNQLIFQTNDSKWHEYDLQNNTTQQLDGSYGSLNSFIFSNSPDSRKTAWIEERDGKKVLLVKDLNDSNSKEKIVHKASGLSTPLHWVYDDMIVFRVSNDQETADYIVNVDGGAPKKISDVSGARGVERWYYY